MSTHYSGWRLTVIARRFKRGSDIATLRRQFGRHQVDFALRCALSRRKR